MTTDKTADKITFTISRRRFVEMLGGLVALIFSGGLASMVLRYLWPAAGKEGGGGEVKIAMSNEVPVGSAKLFRFPDPDTGKASLLIHTPAGFRAFGAVCTHLGCIAAWKQDENIILCPCHLGKFDPNTGNVIAGPPPSPLPAIEIAEKEGAIYALAWKDPDYVKSLSMYA